MKMKKDSWEGEENQWKKGKISNIKENQWKTNGKLMENNGKWEKWKKPVKKQEQKWWKCKKTNENQWKNKEN